ncbi:MAG TPA: NFACT RNA binding domain-containing protein [Caproicibacter sp.]|nr:NFACT RNA binding domain-containing protein [Caproicibacter sp.]
MALDGAFLRHLKREIEETALGAKVDKIYQPNRDELVLSLRAHTGTFKLLMSARANSARINFTKYLPENPKEPPMLCMLLRKRLTGARLSEVRQPGLERMLCLDFGTVNELGDEITLTLVMEVMGRYSNIILVDGEGKIIDALKRVDAAMSSERLVLPGIPYRLPPPQDKLCLLTAGRDEIVERVCSVPDGTELSKALLSSLQGVSPVVCRELQHRTGRGRDLKIAEMTPELKERLSFFLGRLADTLNNIDGSPYMAVGQSRKPMDFSFFSIEQYGTAAIVSRMGSFSELLDAFYGERDRIERMHIRSQDLLRILTTASDRLSRKINNQQAELERCAKRDELRVCGDLLSANLYRLEKGQSCVELQNFYEESQPMVKIRLDPAHTPSQNAQKYYKEYRKAKTAEEILTVQIEGAKQELAYLDTVFEELSRAANERDLSEIRAELTEQGYIRAQKGAKKQNQTQGAMQFRSSDGFQILVGRNNRENDILTLKQAKKTDLWFHTKNIPGSHVVLFLQGKKVTPGAISDAAMLAACFSRGRESSNVAVDYTEVRHVSKPQGSKPGMVIYVNNKTIFAVPDKQAAENLRTK